MSSKAKYASSVAESSTTGHTGSTHTSRPFGAGGPTKIVVTSPPWAKDEPESPLADISPPSEHSPRPSGTSITHVPSVISERRTVSAETLGDHHRWKFALPRSRPKLKRRRSTESLSPKSERGGPIREKRPHPGSSRPGRPRWPTSRKGLSSEVPHTSECQTATRSSSQSSHSDALRIELPLPPPRIPFTLSQNKTPGWETPWTPRMPDRAFPNERDPCLEEGHRVHGNNTRRAKESSTLNLDDLKPWQRQKKKLRNFLLHDTYVPLFLRIVNITFTTVALALAIRIRVIEQDNHIRGAVGSSPVLAIIFAPLTLVHVMIAIYLEYLGRPLGLWRTSAKLAHTLSEVVFICAWSAELALCFDNYFTSPLNCAPRSTVQWYSELPPFQNPLGSNDSGDVRNDANTLCSHQLDLIGVVMVALLLYVTNLIISLFRIFEKVKVHQGWGYGRH